MYLTGSSSGREGRVFLREVMSHSIKIECGKGCGQRDFDQIMFFSLFLCGIIWSNSLCNPHTFHTISAILMAEHSWSHTWTETQSFPRSVQGVIMSGLMSSRPSSVLTTVLYTHFVPLLAVERTVCRTSVRTSLLVAGNLDRFLSLIPARYQEREHSILIECCPQ